MESEVMENEQLFWDGALPTVLVPVGGGGR